MFKFSKDGVILSRNILPYRYVATVTWVWPWRRVERSSGCKYQIILLDPENEVLRENCQDVEVGLDKVAEYGRTKVFPVVAFDLEVALQEKLQEFLSPGSYLIYVPSTKKASTSFWKKHDSPDLGCYAVNIEDYKLPIRILAEESLRENPGRYFLFEKGSITEIDL